MSARRPERRAGDLPVVVPKLMKMMAKERKDPAIASETVVHKGGLDRSMFSVDFIYCLWINAEDTKVAFSASCHCFVNGRRYVFTERTVPGGEQVQKKETAGEILAEKTLNAMIAVTAMIAVATAVIETNGMTVTTEAHPEISMMVTRTGFMNDMHIRDT